MDTVDKNVLHAAMKDAARAELNSSALTAFREKISLSDVKEMTLSDNGKYSQISIDGMDAIEIEGEKVIVVTCEELPDNFFYGGLAFAKLFDTCVGITEGDVDMLNDVLSETPLKISMKSVVTKKGQDFTSITVV